MGIRIENYSHKYSSQGRVIYVPNNIGRDFGRRVIEEVRERAGFPEYFFHLRSGGHVLALKHLRQNKFIAKLDLSKFFYSIGRNRVERKLREIGVDHAGGVARWSTVTNPSRGPKYALPYGFVQSPILASLVLNNSSLGEKIRELQQAMTVAVYVDDICISGDNRVELDSALSDLSRMAAMSGFSINDDKTVSASEAVEAFNCLVEFGKTEVLDSRVRSFYSVERSEASVRGFENYREAVFR